jgi:hypothetical protein
MHGEALPVLTFKVNSARIGQILARAFRLAVNLAISSLFPLT